MGKKLGQHFLKNAGALNKIAQTLNLKRGETIIEIGPGHGELTDKLLSVNEVKLIAIEKDLKLANFLKNKFIKNTKVEIIAGDALEKLESITPSLNKYKLAGNIPYYITGYLFRKIGQMSNKPAVSALMLQKEVAERLAAKPPKMNKLAASVQIWAKPKIIEIVPRKLFVPPPEVDSAIIRLDLKAEHNPEADERYYRMVNILFKQPRKTILNNLAEGLDINKPEIRKKLEKAGFERGLRAQNLGVESIILISGIF